jgi:ABC-type multidrug transport system permease subunit
MSTTAVCSSFDSAFRLASFFIPNMIQYAGYMIPAFDMKRWLFWIYYINPISYAFSGAMENEFMRISVREFLVNMYQFSLIGVLN